MARRLPTWLTERERARLQILELGKRDRAILALFLYAGLRSNELRMLDVEDVDFEAGMIHIRYGKRSKERLVPLHIEARLSLREYLGERQSGAIFASYRGQRISNRGLRFLVGRWGNLAGIRKKLHPHALRHTFAVALLEADVDLETIRDLLGHESIQTTSIYLHCTTERKRAAVDRL